MMMASEDEESGVSELRGQVKEKSSQLDAVSTEIQSIRDKIKQEIVERKNYISEATRVEEASELAREYQKVRDTLQAKQGELRSLHNAESAHEQRELERVREEVEELLKHQQQVQLQREQDILAIEELKRRSQLVEEHCSDTKTRLEHVTQELSRQKENNKKESSNKPGTSRRRKQPLSVRLDHFILTSCNRAGLQL